MNYNSHLDLFIQLSSYQLRLIPISHSQVKSSVWLQRRVNFSSRNFFMLLAVGLLSTNVTSDNTGEAESLKEEAGYLKQLSYIV